VWATTVNGRQLHFHLAGINNQNFIMRDEETGSWWQQVTGEAILGPLKGARLQSVPHDELTFSVWRREQAQGRVLRPDPRVAQADQYESADWEARMQRVKVATNDRDKTTAQRTLVVGLSLNGAAKAYPMDLLVQQSPINDTVGGVPVVLVVYDDQRSVRAFERVLDGRPVEFFARSPYVTPSQGPGRLVEAASGSEWDFTGRAIAGPLTGRQLKQIPILNDYWFDWHTYHPDTSLYNAGTR
jgi:Protein of unknown function (DUF3179)